LPSIPCITDELFFPLEFSFFAVTPFKFVISFLNLILSFSS
jgi:hypothetical protein